MKQVHIGSVNHVCWHW